MIPAKLTWPQQSSDIVNLQGGVDENVSSLQRSAGTLLEVANYMIAEGSTGGYQSVAGYERFDGTTKSSDIFVTTLSINNPIADITTGQTITGLTGSATALGNSVIDGTILTVEVTIVSDTFIRDEIINVDAVPNGTFRNTKLIKPTKDFFAAYDANRALITEVGGAACEGKVLGITIFDNSIYAFRKKVSVAFIGMYKATASGWVEVDTSADPIAYGTNDFRFTEYNFYANAESRSLYWVDGVNQARSYDGTTVETIINCGMSTLDNPHSPDASDNDTCLQLSKLEHGWENMLEITASATGVLSGEWVEFTVTNAALRTFFDTYGIRMKMRRACANDFAYPVYVTAGAANEVTFLVQSAIDPVDDECLIYLYYDQDQPVNTTTVSAPTRDKLISVISTVERDFSVTATIAPINIVAKSNRLYLAYSGGSLQYSELGNPYGFSGVLGAGEIGTGDEITNLVIGVGGALVIFNKSSILVIDGETPSTWTINTFSPTSGAYSKTAKRLLGTMFFLDDRGVTTLEAVDSFGDFAANSISANFKNTLLRNIDNTKTSVVSRELNQYRIYFDGGLGILVSFKGKDLQGATFTEFPLTVNLTAEGSVDNRNVIIFATDTPTYAAEATDGYVYIMDSGTSFDNHNIITKMSTSYYHYRSPRRWKRFLSVMIEGETSSSTLLDIKAEFDYGDLSMPKPEFILGQSGTVSEGSIYGSSEYGTAIYGSGAVLSRTPVYLAGFGTNASFKILTNLKHTNQHVLQNLLVDYTVLSRRI